MTILNYKQECFNHYSRLTQSKDSVDLTKENSPEIDDNKVLLGTFRTFYILITEKAAVNALNNGGVSSFSCF